MRSFSRPHLLILLPLAALLAACSFSLAEDITPPPGSEQLAAVTAAPQTTLGPLYPLVPANPADGAPIYAEKCAPCHGPGGQGDGPQAAQLPNPATAIGSPEVARAATPANWYTQVTKGNLERFMPPFASLSDRERWDVVAYVFSLSAPPEVLEQGGALYQANCARCHGEGGKGDGPEASGLPMPDFSDRAYMAGRSAADFFQAITSGVQPNMPAFENELSEEERWAIAAYLRSLTFAAPGEPLAEAQPTAPESTAIASPSPTEVPAASEQALGKITGRVVNASDGSIPADLDLTLHGFDNMQIVITQTTTVQADGSFAFENVAMPPGRAFVVITEYQGTLYNSTVKMVEPGQTSLELPIEVYDTTTDASILHADRLHLFFEFLDSETVRVVALYVISNPTNKTLVPPEEGKPTVEFILPAGATNLEFQDGQLGQRYIQTAEGFGDTLPVPPGEGHYEVLFAYQMPYDRKLVLSQPVPIPVQAVVILVPEGGVKIKSDQLRDSGTQDVQGAKFHIYEGEALASGESLELTITGRPAAGAPTLASGSNTNLAIGLGVFGLALVLAGVWVYWRTRSSAREGAEEDLSPAASDEASALSVDSLMDAIIALDDLYQAGQLPEEAYQKRRAELKAQLQARMEGE